VVTSSPYYFSIQRLDFTEGGVKGGTELATKAVNLKPSITTPNVLMKKLLLVSTLALTLSSLSTLGQGYFQFQGPTRGVWDGFTPSLPPHLAATMNVAFLIAPANTTPLVSSVAPSSPTNSAILGSGNSAILNDPNFSLAIDANTSALASVPNSASGSWFYTTTGGFAATPITGTTANTTYTVYVIAWNKFFATPQAAAAASFPLGWSSPFQYTAVNNIGTPSTFAASGFVPFGIVIPEPSPLAQTSLGGFALMQFRRRNKVS
jgi:hypothetical protein